MTSPRIHPTATVDPAALLGEDVVIGPGAVIEAETAIGDGCRIGAGAVVKRWTRLGRHNTLKEYAVLGGDPQHAAYRGERTFLEIGDDNIIGEFVTIHRAYRDGESTRVGNGNYFMAYSHVGHDAIVGDHVVFTNFAAAAGHCVIEDRAILAGYVGLHQFVRVGTMCMIGGDSKLNKDAVPYMTYLGVPAGPVGVNLVGLRRNGIPEDRRTTLREAFKILFRRSLAVPDAIRALRDELPATPEIEHLIHFVEESPRGIAV